MAGGEARIRERAASLLQHVGFAGVVCRASFAFDDDTPLPDLIVVAGALACDLCAEARAIPALANVPILAITDDAVSALAAGASDVLAAEDTAGLIMEEGAPGLAMGSSAELSLPGLSDEDLGSAAAKGLAMSLDGFDEPEPEGQKSAQDRDYSDGSVARVTGEGLGPGALDSRSAAIVRGRVERLIDDGRARREAELLEVLQESMARIVTQSGQAQGVGAIREALLTAVDAMGFDRASLIGHMDGSETVYVIAATDDPTLFQFSLMIESYPEIEMALDTGEPVLIADVTTSPITAPVASMLASTEVRAVAVFPLIWRGHLLGVVMYRKAHPGLERMGTHRLSFARMVSGHLAGCLQSSQVLEGLREQTQRISRARYEAERRSRTIESLKEHFEAAADGVIVLEQSGRILYVNRTAEDITGFARSGLIGADVGVLVAEVQRDVVRQVIEQVIGGHNLEAFDLSLRTTSDDSIWASVTTSTVLSSSSAATLSFRDVTAQRALEAELRKTKEFLEKLIDSTVDAIVAADMRGNVIIFNQGAERMYGYAAEEVIGRVPVWQLYAQGVPKQVMRMLRSTQYGGVGRLEQTRREILSKQGELVPVNMTASIIYEDGREMATVGIFSDLRDRIRIEQRLLRAQEKLQLTEKQAVIAELAGTTAHELNQPLQSIMSYTELLQRKHDPDDPRLRAIGVILSEVERMAEIVRKIGRITRYETTEYVGSTRVIDLELSSPGHSLPATDSSPSITRPVVSMGSPVPIAVDDYEDEVTNQVEIDALLAGKEGRAGSFGESSAGANAGPEHPPERLAEGPPEHLVDDHLVDAVPDDFSEDEITSQVEVDEIVLERGRPGRQESRAESAAEQDSDAEERDASDAKGTG